MYDCGFTASKFCHGVLPYLDCGGGADMRVCVLLIQIVEVSPCYEAARTLRNHFSIHQDANLLSSYLRRASKGFRAELFTREYLTEYGIPL
jgi:hypothetical protein